MFDLAARYFCWLVLGFLVRLRGEPFVEGDVEVEELLLVAVFVGTVWTILM